MNINTMKVAALGCLLGLLIGTPLQSLAQQKSKSATSTKTTVKSPEQVPAGAAGLAETLDPKFAVFFFADMFQPSLDIYKAAVKNLPKDVRILIVIPDYFDSPENKSEFQLEGFPKKRFEFVVYEDFVSANAAEQVGNWARDYIPDLVKAADGQSVLVAADSASTIVKRLQEALAQKFGLPLIRSKVVMEGGNLLFDTNGRLFLTKETITRNSNSLSEAEIEANLKTVYGAKEIIWMPIIPGEPTGHIDMYAKLIAEDTVLVADSNVAAQSKALDDAADIFTQYGFKVARVRNAPLKDHGQRTFFLPYTNLVTFGKTALVPSYTTTHQDLAETDKATVNYLTNNLGMNVISVPSFDLTATYQGSVHCTMKLWYHSLPRVK